MLLIIQVTIIIYGIVQNQQERVYLYGKQQIDISFNNQKIDNYEIVEKENGNDLIIHFEKI
jgi:hypothetical protein